MLKTMINEIKDFRKGEPIEFDHDSVTNLPASADIAEQQPSHTYLASGGHFVNLTPLNDESKESVATTVIEDSEKKSSTDLDVDSAHEQ